ncbi:hypothetical protein NEFER03_0922 [Nematocida sp. LUAm3]|nr:hypothetical protein NEFER03_0922 [Nematocida sp. LUAm3]KAI5174940.1 hypothetical protein NEFER02_1040 [Nematocida sp. LUAm2]KAI5177461.1 hypothetical protein NEFER01_0711 [Nematocida sp. LUAm1]
MAHIDTSMRQKCAQAKERDRAQSFALLDIFQRNLTIYYCKKHIKYFLRNVYTSIHTNKQLLERNAFVGQTEEGSLFLVKYQQKKEDLILSGTEAFVLYNTTIAYTSGKLLSTIDISTGDKKVVVESDVGFSKCKLLVANEILVIICTKTIHRLNLSTHLYTKVRLKVDIDIGSACIVGGEKWIHVAVSCTKGNVYLFEAQKMEMFKSMKSFGCQIYSMCIPHKKETILVALLASNEIVEIDYQSNRLLKRSALPMDSCKSILFLEEDALAVFSSTQIGMYSSHGFRGIHNIAHPNSLVYMIPEAPEFFVKEGSQIHFSSEEEKEVYSPPQKPPVFTNVPASKHVLSSSAHAGPPHGSTPHQFKGGMPSEIKRVQDTNNAPPRFPYNTMGKASPSFLQEKDHKQKEDIFEFLQAFKDSVYTMQSELLREVFVIRKRLDEIEKHLTE